MYRGGGIKSIGMPGMFGTEQVFQDWQRFLAVAAL